LLVISLTSASGVVASLSTLVPTVEFSIVTPSGELLYVSCLLLSTLDAPPDIPSPNLSAIINTASFSFVKSIGPSALPPPSSTLSPPLVIMYPRTSKSLPISEFNLLGEDVNLCLA